VPFPTSDRSRRATDCIRKHLKAGRPAATRVQELSSGAVINTESEDEEAFWDWAVVETLRHSGMFSGGRDPAAEV
jgi:hypothetical protein